ncbi:serine/threonine-protein kinase [Alienimonas chondri]|uniref:Serine/threonine-protein kinase PknD n=1 Tax=Alienimonas chondri TaxID=2681879 RepID=A0ABX1VFN3_9PLAN|nr:serine/threonine-protein kinase [Alienimonas chondri]NNJ26647.1 Serine/threonine-protein kinase PknD [Alienimonas chondri]
MRSVVGRPPGTPPSLPDRYTPIERIGVGGIGEVWRVVDANLDRDLAVKVLRPDRRTPDHAARLVREALLTGRLQHPGVPPVVERGGWDGDASGPGADGLGSSGHGANDDGPFFAMKLVGGRTLRQILKGTPRPDPARLLGVFRQVCDAVGFAHAAGVIHRDIKPANVMVGDHGEVQVMDWGMARLLKGEAGEPDFDPEEETILPPFRRRPVWDDSSAQSSVPGNADDTVLTAVPPVPDAEAAPDAEAPGTVPSDDPPAAVPPTGSHSTRAPHSDVTVQDPLATMTQAGSGLGTPAYMPPEQARGEMDHVDARSDVFGLGAVLCSILTGKPPFPANDPLVSLRQAAAGDLGPALARLDAADVDEPLKDLCRRCLSVDPADRPEDGTAVADAVRDYETSVRERLEQARADRAAAEVRVVEERKRRRIGIAALAALLIAGAAGALWFDASERLGVVRQERAEAKAAAVEADEARNKEEFARLAAEAARAAAVRSQSEAERKRIEADEARLAAVAAEENARRESDRSRLESEKARMESEQAKQDSARAAAVAMRAEKDRAAAEQAAIAANEAAVAAEKTKAEALAAAETARRERESLVAERAAAEVRTLIDRAGVRRDADQFAAAADLLDAAERLAPSAGDRLSENALRDARRHLTVAADLGDARLPRTGEDAWHGGTKERTPSEASDPADRFAAIFDAYGMDMVGGAPETLGRAVAASPVAPALLAGLDGWARAAAASGDTDTARRLRTIAAAADPTPLREALAEDKPDRVTTLLLTEVSPESVSPETAALIAHWLLEHTKNPKVQAAATTWLELSIEAHPSDYWLRRLRAEFAGDSFWEARQRVESLQVAVALRPDAVDGHFALGQALEAADRWPEAAVAYRRVTELTGAPLAKTAGERMAALGFPPALTRGAGKGSPTETAPPLSAVPSADPAAPASAEPAALNSQRGLAAWAKAAGLSDDDLPEPEPTP